jgi:hypothetical protein
MENNHYFFILFLRVSQQLIYVPLKSEYLYVYELNGEYIDVRERKEIKQG